MPEAIFVPEGNRWLPTEAALSPWGTEGLHGSCPSMLMAREVERFGAEQPMVVTRLTVELLRPFGLVPVEARVRLLRPGRKVQLVEASLWHGDLEVVRATAVRIRAAEVAVPEPDPLPPPSLPEGLEPSEPRQIRGMRAYHTLGVEVRPNPARPGIGPGWAWFRLRLPLVPGEEPSPLVRVCAAADFPNGISSVVSWAEMIFINPDVTITVHRLPVDEWVCVDARTWLEPSGTGMAEGALYDRRGRIGRSVQTLLVEPRSGRAPGAPTAS